MGINTKYGFCKGECQKWLPRDKMLAMNVSVYDKHNNETKIQLRFCEECHKQMQDYLGLMAWDNNLLTEAQLRSDLEKAKQAGLEYDDSLEVVTAAKRAQERREPIEFKSPTKKRIYRNRDSVNPRDDSEAAMRKRGKRVDVSY